MVSVLAFEEAVNLSKLCDTVFSVFKGVSFTLNDLKNKEDKNVF